MREIMKPIKIIDQSNLYWINSLLIHPVQNHVGMKSKVANNQSNHHLNILRDYRQITITTKHHLPVSITRASLNALQDLKLPCQFHSSYIFETNIDGIAEKIERD